MATKRNDIALSFDRAEYYTLQEASEYLNRKNGIDNITPKKLLKHIASYDVNIYIHFRMDNLKEQEKLFFEFDFYDSNIFETDENIYQYDSQDSYLSDKLAICDKVNKNISNKLKDDLYMGFILFLMDKRTIQNMALSIKQKNDEVLFCFDGFIYRDNLNDNPESPKQLKEWAVTVNDKEYYIYDVANLGIKILSKKKAILDDFKAKIPFPCDFYTFDEWDIVIVNLKITIDDLIILHKDLELLEKKIIENAPIPEKEYLKVSDVSYLVSRKGVSPRKLQAKLIANAHAQHLWAKDHDKKIRVGEMCETLKAYLAETEYSDQLPEKAENLKDWLNNIPPHAKEAGRPSEQ